MYFGSKPAVFDEGYLKASGNMSWYDFIAAMPHLVFVVTGWKSNKKANASLYSWATLVGASANDFICILSKVDRGGHMYHSLKETGVCVLNFPTYGIYERCIKTIGNNLWEADEITASGLTLGRAQAVDAPIIEEAFLHIECRFLWEHTLTEESEENTVALKAVGLSMASERYDQSKLGRYGREGYLFQVDQPTNSETGEKSPIMVGVLEPLPSLPWQTK